MKKFLPWLFVGIVAGITHAWDTYDMAVYDVARERARKESEK